MDDPLILRIADLRAALNQVLVTAEELLGPKVRLDLDYYWHVPVENAFDLARVPQQFTTGQLSDDLHELLEQDHERVPQEAWHELSHLIGVLRALELSARR
jgi:hypothetical protein